DATAYAGRTGEAGCLDVVGISPSISDIGKCEGHDLPCIGGISENFLIAGDRGVEANLACGFAGGAGTEPLNDHSVCENSGGRVGPVRPGRVVSMAGGCHGTTSGLALLSWRAAPTP